MFYQTDKNHNAEKNWYALDIQVCLFYKYIQMHTCNNHTMRPASEHNGSEVLSAMPTKSGPQVNVHNGRCSTVAATLYKLLTPQASCECFHFRSISLLLFKKRKRKKGKQTKPSWQRWTPQTPGESVSAGGGSPATPYCNIVCLRHAFIRKCRRKWREEKDDEVCLTCRINRY